MLKIGFNYRSNLWIYILRNIIISHHIGFWFYNKICIIWPVTNKQRDVRRLPLLTFRRPRHWLPTSWVPVLGRTARMWDWPIAACGPTARDNNLVPACRTDPTNDAYTVCNGIREKPARIGNPSETSIRPPVAIESRFCLKVVRKS